MHDNTRADLGKLILRLVLGILILLHGIAKLKGGLGGIPGLVAANDLPAFVAYGVLIGEVVAPLMLLAGYHARIGALIIAINMVAAIVLAHMGQLGQFNARGGWALELQGMFLFAAIASALLGPGAYSLSRK